MPDPVLRKVDFVRRYAAGEFGNASPTWDDLAQYQASGYTDLVHVRNRVAAGRTWYNVSVADVPAVWAEAKAIYRPSMLYISAMAPTDKTLFQGEVQRGSWGYELLFSTVAKPMRDALREQSRCVTGVVASVLLKHFLCPRSLEWLGYLLDAYPGHVVEFSTYSVEWGTVAGFNTVFWEVRRY